jgi:ABC-type glycerol-3-phosphate transport system permease component
VVVSGISTAIVVILGAAAAYSLTRYRYRGRNAIAKLLLLAYMFPPIILIVPLFIFAHSLALTNSRIGVSLSYISFSLPYAIWILRAFFQGLPIELEHAAWIDGASRSQGLIYIVIPSALPGIIATAIFTFIVAWNDFLFASVLISVDRLKTLPVGINDFFHMAVVDWGLIMAAGVMITIPAVVFFVAVQQYLVEGWGAGAVKG